MPASKRVRRPRMFVMRHPIYFVVCCHCGREAPLVKRGSIEPPDAWSEMWTECCPSERFYVCAESGCRTSTVRQMLHSHEGPSLLVHVFGVVPPGSPVMLSYSKRGSLLAQQILQTA